MNTRGLAPLFEGSRDSTASDPGPTSQEVLSLSLPAAFTCATALAVALRGGVCRDKSKLHWLVFALGLSLAAASLGIFAAEAAASGMATPGQATRSTLLMLLAVSVALQVLCATVWRDRLVDPVVSGRQEVIAQLGDGVLMADAGGAVLDLNRSAQAVVGKRAIGRPLSDVLAEIAREAESSGLRSELDGLDAIAEPLERELTSRDGRRFDLRALGVREGSGHAQGRVALLRDRTEARRFEEIVRRNQKLETVGTLAAGIAHEINNPLAFVRTNLSQIERMGRHVEQGLAEPRADLAEELADLREVAAETLEGIDRIKRIVADMRRLSTAPSEGFVSVDVNDVVREAVRLAGLRRGAVTRVETQLSASTGRVHGSPQLLVQALLNLLINAEQALADSPDARISVETLDEDDTVAIRVRDNGPGISTELSKRIFDPFFTTKRSNQGTGLGLPIVIDIARDHGGSLEMVSQPGAGATFTLQLPRSH